MVSCAALVAVRAAKRAASRRGSDRINSVPEILE